MYGSSGAGDDDEPLFRPYAVTGGRSEPRYHLAMETLILPELPHLAREARKGNRSHFAK